MVDVELVYVWVGNGLCDSELSSRSDTSDRLSDKTDRSDVGDVGSDVERMDDQWGALVIEILLSSCSEAG